MKSILGKSEVVIIMLSVREISKAASLAASEFGVKRIMLFGSYADGRNTDESDVDLLVEFSAASVSLLTISALKIRLEELLGAEVDIIRFPIPKGAIIRPEKVVEIYAA